MTIVGHAVSGWIGFRLFRKRGGRPPIGWTLAALIIPCLPDLDVLGMKFIPYGNLFGHRGLSHSFFAAIVFGVALTVLAARLGQVDRSRRSLMMAFVFGASLWASHGVLDAMTTGGKGVALWAPVSGERIWLPARVIPVSLLPGDLAASPDRLQQIRDFVMARTSVGVSAAGPRSWSALVSTWTLRFSISRSRSAAGCDWPCSAPPHCPWPSPSAAGQSPWGRGGSGPPLVLRCGWPCSRSGPSANPRACEPRRSK